VGRVNLWRRLKNVVVHRILGVSDTPRRIAWGMFLGTVIAFTPTIGFQIMLYVAFATMLRANKVSGIPILFISNPFTAVPLYWFCWKVGAFVMGRGGGDSEAFNALMERIEAGEETAAEKDIWTDIWTADFWSDVGNVLLDMGLELWVGSFVLGFACAIPLYFLTLVGVRSYRRAKGR